MRLNDWKMKPISRLRMRARSGSERPWTGRSFRMYEPSVGESRRPRMERRVDLPQPEGPAIETYSPFLMSIWMPDNAWVSTSSVRKTFVTPSSLMRESDMGVGVGFGDTGGTKSGGRSGFG